MNNRSDEPIIHSRGLCQSVTNLDDRIGEFDIQTSMIASANLIFASRSVADAPE